MYVQKLSTGDLLKKTLVFLQNEWQIPNIVITHFENIVEY
jgi:hypothetical protein